MEAVVTFERLNHYFSKKKVFITGHTGFKGGWLVALLHSLGAKLKGFALEPDRLNDTIFNSIEPLNVIENVFADIRDKKKLSREIEVFQPDFIFHLAAQPLVRSAYEIPAETFDVNVTGTANVLESIIDLKKKCAVILITTDKVYKNKEKDILYKEDDVLGGHDPYSASKACAEFVIKSFRDSFFNVDNIDKHQKALASARAGNVIGGGDWSKDRIFPDIMRAVQENKFIELRNPASIRPWQHVLEPLTGYLLLAGMLNENPKKFSGAYNFGPYPEDHVTVQQLVELVLTKWEREGEWNNIGNELQPHEAHLLKLDISKAETELNWHPKLNANEAIEWTIEWYKCSNQNKTEFTFQQIKEYFSL